MSVIKLGNLGVGSLGEPARLILKYANVNFTDERYKLAEWPTLKSKTKTGKLPYLEFDGYTIIESYAIYRFLARKYNLTGKDEFEAALIDSIADIQKDFNSAVSPWLQVARKNVEGSHDVLEHQHLIEPCKTFFPILSNYLKESKSGYMAPTGLSWVDFVITEFFTAFMEFKPKIFNDFPELKEYLEYVHQIPQLKEYYSQRSNPYWKLL